MDRFRYLPDVTTLTYNEDACAGKGASSIHDEETKTCEVSEISQV